MLCNLTFLVFRFLALYESSIHIRDYVVGLSQISSIFFCNIDRQLKFTFRTYDLGLTCNGVILRHTHLLSLKIFSKNILSSIPSSSDNWNVTVTGVCTYTAMSGEASSNMNIDLSIVWDSKFSWNSSCCWTSSGVIDLNVIDWMVFVEMVTLLSVDTEMLTLSCKTNVDISILNIYKCTGY